VSVCKSRISQGGCCARAVLVVATCVSDCRRRTIGVTLVGGASVPWLVGAVCSLLASVDYDNLVDFDVCRQSVVYLRQKTRPDDDRTLSWTSALVVSYWVVLVLVSAWLSAAYFRQRRSYATTLLRRDPTAMSRDRSGLSRDDVRRRTSCISGAGSSSPDIAVGDAAAAGAAAAADMSRRESSSSYKKKRLSRKQSGERASKSSEVCRLISPFVNVYVLLRYKQNRTLKQNRMR